MATTAPATQDIRRDTPMTKFIAAKWILPAVAAAGIAATAVPGLASAQNCYQQRQDNRTTGAVLGAVAGGAIGGATSGHREKGVGTVGGAIVGAMLGSAVGGDTRCRYDDRYAYSDNRGGDYDRDRYAYDAPPPPQREVVYDAPPPPPVVYRETVYDAPPPVVVYGDGYYYHRTHYRHWHRW